jgi:hypothetical protein
LSSIVTRSPSCHARLSGHQAAELPQKKSRKQITIDNAPKSVIVNANVRRNVRISF